jgi:hypothetical protein
MQGEMECEEGGKDYLVDKEGGYSAAVNSTLPAKFNRRESKEQEQEKEKRAPKSATEN